MQVASAYGHEPVATTSLLAYVLCHELHPTLEEKVAWLGVLGTFGDLGSSVKWHDPFPDMTAAIKQHGGKTKFSQAVSLINARELTHASPWLCLALSVPASGLTCNRQFCCAIASCILHCLKTVHAIWEAASFACFQALCPAKFSDGLRFDRTTLTKWRDQSHNQGALHFWCVELCTCWWPM